MRRFRTITVPKQAHPLVRLLFERMNHERIGIMDVADRSGVSREAIKHWRNNHIPNLQNLEACFGVLGYQLTIKRNRIDSDDDHDT